MKGPARVSSVLALVVTAAMAPTAAAASPAAASPAASPPTTDGPTPTATVHAFMASVDAAMVRPSAVRLARSATGTPAEWVATEMDRPDPSLCPTAVARTGERTTRLREGVYRSCATWVTTYNTGPQSSTDTCWDLTVDGDAVVAAQPYGTDQILAEAPACR